MNQQAQEIKHEMLKVIHSTKPLINEDVSTGYYALINAINDVDEGHTFTYWFEAIPKANRDVNRLFIIIRGLKYLPLKRNKTKAHKFLRHVINKGDWLS